MRKTILLTSLLLLTGLALGAPQGETLFKKNCAVCHGNDGKGNTPQGRKLGAANLTTSDIQSMSDSGIAGIVRNGRGVMPPFSKSLTPGQIKEVVQFVKTLGK